MKRPTTLWPVAAAGLVCGLAGLVLGTLLGGELGPLVAGYGLLVALAAIWMGGGLAIRDRVWRHLHQAAAPRVNDAIGGRHAGLRPRP